MPLKSARVQLLEIPVEIPYLFIRKTEMLSSK